MLIYWTTLWTDFMDEYYVYVLCDPRRDDEPFYVGKGKGDRARTHLHETKDKTDNPWKHAKIAKIREAGLEPVIQYRYVELNEEEAYSLETNLIKRYGRAKIDPNGILTNICVDNRPPDPTGRPCLSNTRKKIGDAQRGELNHRHGVKWSDEEKQRRSEFNKANGIKPPVRRGPMSQEQKDAIRRGNTGKKRTPEQSAYLSEIRRGKKRKPCPEDIKRKISESNKRTKQPKVPEDLTGRQFSAWTVVQRAPDRRDSKTNGAAAIYWLCRCACTKQTEREVRQRNLSEGRSKSCGCRTDLA